MGDITEHDGFKLKQRVRMLVPCIGGDHEGQEHTIAAGAIGEISEIGNFGHGQGIAFTIWIPVHPEPERFDELGIVNVFDQTDGPMSNFFEVIDGA